MKRWTTISPADEQKRWDLLSKHISELGQANEYVPWTGAKEAITDLSLLDGFEHVRISSQFGAQILRSVKVQSSWITLLGVVDGMVKRDGSGGRFALSMRASVNCFLI